MSCRREKGKRSAVFRKNATLDSTKFRQMQSVRLDDFIIRLKPCGGSAIAENVTDLAYNASLDGL